MKKVGVSREEKQLPYYKYFEQDLAPVPEEKLAVLEAGSRRRKKRSPLTGRIFSLQERTTITARWDTGSWTTGPDSCATPPICRV